MQVDLVAMKIQGPGNYVTGITWHYCKHVVVALQDR